MRTRAAIVRDGLHRIGPVLLATLGCVPAAAEEPRAGGKLLLTGGVSSIEGAAGGGLATWGVIAGDETDARGIGGKAHLSYAALPDYDLTTFGTAVGIHDRVELSYARQSFDTRAAGAALGLGRDFTFRQDIFGAKLRVFGDAVYDQDTLLPQVSIGVQHKRAGRNAAIRAIGGRHGSGTDLYIAATKVMLARSMVVNATIRFTKANQTGLLGFGGDRRDHYLPQFEGSVGRLISRRLLIGGEYRTRPSNLGFAREDDAYDLFLAWTPLRHVAVTAAYIDLGSIATYDRQRGGYLSIQTSF